MSKEEGSTFKSLAGLFLAFSDETELNPNQLNHMKGVCNMLNAVDKGRKLNGGVDYRIAPQLDETENNPFYEVDLPDAPENPMPAETVTKTQTVSEQSSVLAEIDFDIAKLTLLRDNTMLFRYDDDDVVVGGTIDFKEGMDFSNKLAWSEKHLR